MKHLKFYSIFLSLSLISQSFLAQSSQRTLVKSFNTHNITRVNFDIPGDVIIQEWDQPMLRVQMDIKLENGNDNVLKGLISARRYNLESKRENESLTIFSDALLKNVSFSGEDISENLKFIIKAPIGMEINMPITEAIGFAEEKKK